MKPIKNYYAPTPIFWRKLGDSLLAASSMVTAASIANESHTAAYSALGIGVLGKFLSNFFTEDSKGSVQ